MAECHLVIIKRNGEDLTEQLLAPGTEWKIGKYVFNMCVFSNHMRTPNTNKAGAFICAYYHLSHSLQGC